MLPREVPYCDLLFMVSEEKKEKKKDKDKGDRQSMSCLKKLWILHEMLRDYYTSSPPSFPLPKIINPNSSDEAGPTFYRLQI